MASFDSKTLPDLFYEETAGGIVAGVDEAGRGPLAGPVVVAAVILDRAHVPQGLDDSKKLGAKMREKLFDAIMESATVSVVSAPPKLIATLNIRGATLWAMRQAVLGLAVRPDRVLIDGRDVPPRLPVPGQALIGGDGLSVSIAAASIIAKVTRDRMCTIMDFDSPAFGFHQHKGYGTKAHLAELNRFGPSAHHRLDFAPCVAAGARKISA